MQHFASNNDIQYLLSYIKDTADASNVYLIPENGIDKLI